MRGIKWLENISCVFIIAILAYMLYVVRTQFATEIDDVFSGIKGTWGMPFWAATTSFLGNLFHHDHQCIRLFP